jgi:chorismate synthase
MKNVYGTRLKVGVFGESHAPEIGVELDGIPAGTVIDFQKLQAFMDRRAPGRDEFSTPRKEADRPKFTAGVTAAGVTDGGMIRAVIRNTNVRSHDYESVVPRPGHADWPAYVKFGAGYSFAGGGRFSGRLTAPLCIAGGIALQMLERRGIAVGDLLRSKRAGFANEGRVDRNFPAERRFEANRLRRARFRIRNDAANRSAAKNRDAARLR